MKYLVYAIMISLCLVHCSDGTVKDPMQSSRQLDFLLQRYNYKLAAIDFEQPEKDLYNLALSLLNEQRDFLSAEKVFRHLLIKKPNSMKYKFHLGRSLFLIGEYNYFQSDILPYRIAFTHFTDLVKKHPWSTDFLLMRSYCAGRMAMSLRKQYGLSTEVVSRFSDVIDNIEAILKLNPDHADASLTRGEIFYFSPPIFGGSKSRGSGLYKKINKKYPQNMRAYLLLGSFYLDKKNYSRSLDFYQKALELYKTKKSITPEEFLVYTLIPKHIGTIHLRLKNYKQALSMIKLHLKRQPYSAPGYHLLALCNDRLGKVRTAIKYYKLALKYDKWDLASKKRLHKLNRKLTKN